MPKMIVLSPVNHDGVDYVEGDELDVKVKAQAEALAACGAAEFKDKKAADKPADPPQE